MVPATYFTLAVVATLCCTACGYAQLVLPNSNVLVAKVDMNNIEALFTFTPVTKGTGAEVNIDVTKGLSKSTVLSPSKGFDYHVHVNRVGPNNDCMATGGHLDPTNVGAAKCNPSIPEKCQEGDLSGKHGELRASESGAIPNVRYIDRQLHFDGETTTLKGRSIVIHNNGTRVACGNILTLEEVTNEPAASSLVQSATPETEAPVTQLTSDGGGSRFESGFVQSGQALAALGAIGAWMMTM